MSTLNRYSKTLMDIYSIVKDFEIENIKIVPVGFKGTESPTEYVRFNPVFSEKPILNNLKGILYFDIFTLNGAGPTRALLIADLIEKYFAGKSFESVDTISNTQFSPQSNLVVKGEDKNPAFILTTYQIQFNNFRKDL